LLSKLFNLFIILLVSCLLALNNELYNRMGKGGHGGGHGGNDGNDMKAGYGWLAICSIGIHC